MANTNAPFGFQHVGYMPGYATDQAYRPSVIASDYSTNIYFGDPVLQMNTGYIQQAVNGATLGPIGIFYGCEMQLSDGRVVYSPYWPGGGAANAVARVMMAPGALFKVQANAGPITFADIGQNADFTIGSGSTKGGCFSGATLSGLGTTATLPFRIVGLMGGAINAGGQGEQGNGSDNTSAYNHVLVTFNQQDFRAGTGGV